MLNKDNQGKVMTVLGPIEPNQVGNTTTHDHVLINFQAILTCLLYTSPSPRD